MFLILLNRSYRLFNCLSNLIKKVGAKVCLVGPLDCTRVFIHDEVLEEVNIA